MYLTCKSLIEKTNECPGQDSRSTLYILNKVSDMQHKTVTDNKINTISEHVDISCSIFG